MRFLRTTLDEISRRHGVPGAGDNWSNDHELPWLDRIQKAFEAIPACEAEFIGEMMCLVDTTKLVAADYDL